MQQISVEHRRLGAADAVVQLDVAVGELTLGDTSTTEMLVQGEVRLPEGVELEQECRLRGETVHCALETRHKRNLSSIRDAPRWRLRLGRGIPIALKLKSGAAEAHLDLSALAVTDLDVDSGVGRTTVVVPRLGQVRARIKAGVGEMIVRVPIGMAARIRVSSGIGAVKIASRFQRTTNAYQSSDYDTATDRVDLRIEAGVGRIAVESLD